MKNPNKNDKAVAGEKSPAHTPTPYFYEDGAAMFHAENIAKAAIAKAEGGAA